MMTIKEARKFKAKLDEGEFPPLPKALAHILQMQTCDIINAIRQARRFGYGSGPLHYARRLHQMGLFDAQFQLTNYGDSYVNALENTEEAHK